MTGSSGHADYGPQFSSGMDLAVSMKKTRLQVAGIAGSSHIEC